jgi:predicted acylesterase/phospholipase RssA
MTAGELTGVVLSGGGANGAYEVGVLKALTHGASPATGHQPIDPEIYTGTSVGSYNAAIMTSRPGQPASAVTEELEALWLERIANTILSCGNGVFRARGLPFQFFDPGCFLRPLQTLANNVRDTADLAVYSLLKGVQFAASDTSFQSRVLSLIDLQAFVSAAPLHGLVEETIDLSALRRSEKRLTIAASNWQVGVLRLFSKQEIADTFGTDAILASAAIPGIFAPVEVGGVPYVDGGVLLNTPLQPAISDGATTIHVIFLDPLVRDVELKPLPSTLDTAWRMMAIMWASSMRKDILIAAGINRILELLESGAPESAFREDAQTFLRAGWQMVRRIVEGRARPYRKLTVHMYRPQSALGEGEGLLDFQHARLKGLVEMGYSDAVQHNCAVEGCLLPGRPLLQEEDLERRFNPRRMIA